MPPRFQMPSQSQVVKYKDYLWKAERDVCVIVGRAVLLLPLLEPLHDALHRRKVLHHVAQDLPRLRRHFLTNFALRELKFEYALLPKSS